MAEVEAEKTNVLIDGAGDETNDVLMDGTVDKTNDMLMDDNTDVMAGKLPISKDNPCKQNGLDADDGESLTETPAGFNGVSEDHPVEKPSHNVMDSETKKQEYKMLENGDFEEDKGDHVESIEDASSVKNVDIPVVLSDNGDSDAVESIGNSNSLVGVNSDDAIPSDENSSEAMEVDSKVDDEDDDSNVVELSSNVSAATSDVIGVDRNTSNNPSLISEDSSRDSVDSIESVKSRLSSNSKQSDTLVGTVKDDDGDDILITLNDEEIDNKEKRTGENEKTEIKSIEEVKEETAKDESEQSENKIENQKVEGGEKDLAKILENGPVSAIAPVTSQAVSTVAVSSIVPGTSLLLPAPIPVLGPQQNMVPAGYQLVPQGNLVQQGNQFGYISVVGKQRIFIPATNAIQAANTANSSMIVKQLSNTQQKPQKQNVKNMTTPKPEDLRPKSSWEMIELMKWEIQNRIPDNYNWSVAFHGRKEELSTVTAFLQELGSDVVKEQVYKDIIQIQTKKKVAGDLKDAEVESLEKMKTVYENTKKKVEHLQLQTKECDKCRFKTESCVIMDYHNDFPHYDPPWDLNRGWLMCAQSDCDFKTKTVAHFIFHQKDIHNVQAKFIEKDQYFQCPLCPLNASTKNKLEKHQQKCMKHFKLNANLQPYYHDVNFSMKTCFYKPKKIITKPPPPPPKPLIKPTTTMLTRQHGTAPVVQPVSQQSQPIKPHTNVAIRQRLPLMRNPITQQIVPRSMMQQHRPMTALQRAPVLQQRPTVPQQRLPGPPQKAVRHPGREMAGFEVCELCGGYVKDRQALRIHFYYAHKVEMPQAIFNRPNPPLTCEVCKSHFWTTQGLAKHKSAQRHFIGATKPTPGISGKMASEQECFMCMKLFPNLFVHFEKIHGMTMKDLVLVRKCIMCGLAASDYRSLETHLVNAHGVLIRVNDYINDRNKVVKPSTAIIGGGKNVGKINYCVFCQIQFPDNIQLTMHCIKVHATCDTCGMVVATSKHLSMGHSCRKAHINRSCYICGTMVISQDKYAIHLRSHVKPCRVKLQNLNEEEIAAVKNKLKREYKPAVISLDSDEDSDVEVVETKPSKTKNMLEKVKGACKDVEMVDLSKDNDEMRKTTEKPEEKKMEEEKDKNIDSDRKVEDVEIKVHDLEHMENEFQVKSKQTDDGVEADKRELKPDVSESNNKIKKDGSETGDESSGNSKDEMLAELAVKMEDEKMTEENGRETGKEIRETTNLVETICSENDSDEMSVESEKGKKKKENGNEVGEKRKKETFEGTEDAFGYEKNIEVEEVGEMSIMRENEIKEETKTVEEAINKEQISVESIDNNVGSENSYIKSDLADNEKVHLSRNVDEKVIDSTERKVDERKAEYAADENEQDIENKLLEEDEDKESVVSFGSLKRKKSESDIDEDELLRDDSSTKRLKLDNENNDNGGISVIDQTDTNLEQDIAGNEGVQDVEMGDNPSNDEQIETEEDI